MSAIYYLRHLIVRWKCEKGGKAARKIDEKMREAGFALVDDAIVMCCQICLYLLFHLCAMRMLQLSFDGTKQFIADEIHCVCQCVWVSIHYEYNIGMDLVAQCGWQAFEHLQLNENVKEDAFEMLLAFT